VAVAIPAYAAVKATAVRSVQVYIFPDETVTVPIDNAGDTALRFAGTGTHLVTFTAKCSVSSPDVATRIDIDIVLDPDGPLPPRVLDPTGGGDDALCSSNGTWAFDGYSTHSLTVPTPSLGKGTHTVSIRASLYGDSTGEIGMLDDMILVVTK
jgi:hypothetical protein